MGDNGDEVVSSPPAVAANGAAANGEGRKTALGSKRRKKSAKMAALERLLKPTAATASAIRLTQMSRSQHDAGMGMLRARPSSSMGFQSWSPEAIFGRRAQSAMGTKGDGAAGGGDDSDLDGDEDNRSPPRSPKSGRMTPSNGGGDRRSMMMKRPSTAPQSRGLFDIPTMNPGLNGSKMAPLVFTNLWDLKSKIKTQENRLREVGGVTMSKRDKEEKKLNKIESAWEELKKKQEEYDNIVCKRTEMEQSKKKLTAELNQVQYAVSTDVRGELENQLSRNAEQLEKLEARRREEVQYAKTLEYMQARAQQARNHQFTEVENIRSLAEQMRKDVEEMEKQYMQLDIHKNEVQSYKRHFQRLVEAERTSQMMQLLRRQQKLETIRALAARNNEIAKVEKNEDGEDNAKMRLNRLQRRAQQVTSRRRELMDKETADLTPEQIMRRIAAVTGEIESDKVIEKFEQLSANRAVWQSMVAEAEGKWDQLSKERDALQKQLLHKYGANRDFDVFGKRDDSVGMSEEQKSKLLEKKMEVAQRQLDHEMSRLEKSEKLIADLRSGIKFLETKLRVLSEDQQFMTKVTAGAKNLSAMFGHIKTDDTQNASAAGSSDTTTEKASQKSTVTDLSGQELIDALQSHEKMLVNALQIIQQSSAEVKRKSTMGSQSSKIKSKMYGFDTSQITHLDTQYNTRVDWDGQQGNDAHDNNNGHLNDHLGMDNDFLRERENFKASVERRTKMEIKKRQKKQNADGTANPWQ